MPRTAIKVDKNELEKVIQLLEESGPLQNHSKLFDAAGELMGITAAVVRLRVQQWGIKTKTQPGRRTKSTQIESPKPQIQYTQSDQPKRLSIISIPSGRCPYKIKNTSYENIEQWIELTQQYFYKNSKHLRPEAFRYFARMILDDQKKISIVNNHINAICEQKKY